jgi:hypothetical protein
MKKHPTIRRVIRVCVHKGHVGSHVAYLSAAAYEGRSLYSLAAGSLLLFSLALILLGEEPRE